MTAWPVAAYGLAVNLVTFVAFARDKHRAQTKGPRTPERTLLLMAAAGGWPAAFLAQKTFRHKTRKQPFGTWLAVIAGLEATALIGLTIVLRS